MLWNPTNAGAFFPNITRRAIFRGVTTGSFAVAAVGQVLAFDMALQSADTTSGYQPTPGTSKGNSATATTGLGGASVQPADLIFQSVVEPSGESDTVHQVYCVCTNLLGHAGVSGGEIEVMLFGVCDVNTASATYTVGDSLMMSATEANRNLIAFAAGTTDGQRPLAKVITGGTSVTSCRVLFYGGLSGLLPSQATTN